MGTDLERERGPPHDRNARLRETVRENRRGALLTRGKGIAGGLTAYGRETGGADKARMRYGRWFDLVGRMDN